MDFAQPCCKTVEPNDKPVSKLGEALEKFIGLNDWICQSMRPSELRLPLYETCPRTKVFVALFLVEMQDGLKMGKSLGNTIDPKDLVSRFGADAVRYFFLREIEFGKDGDFSEERFLNIVNSHLANTIGNLLHRTLGLLKKNCNSIIPVDPFSISSENPLRQVVDDGVLEAKDYFEDLHFAKACEKLIGIANAGNSYLDEQAPWSAFKKGGKSAESASQDLTVVLEVLRILAVALSPVVPDLCRRVYLQLGYSVSKYEATTWDDTRWGGLMYGQVIATPEPLFRRIGELEKVEGDVLLEAKKPDKIKVSGISTL